MQDDPVIARIRGMRHRISKQCDHDPKKLVEYYMQPQERHRKRLMALLGVRRTKNLRHKPNNGLRADGGTAVVFGSVAQAADSRSLAQWGGPILGQCDDLKEHVREKDCPPRSAVLMRFLCQRHRSPMLSSEDGDHACERCISARPRLLRR